MTNNEKKSLLIVSGDHSADMYVSNIIKELKKSAPDLRIAGTGGDKMKEAGMELLWHLNDMSVIGLWEAIYKANVIKKVRKSLLDFISRNNVCAAMLVDYPGFNLYFANLLKKMNIPVIYFISPQVWAWRSGRIKKIKERVDKILVILPFEEAIYRRAGVDTEFVGHPLLEIMSGESSAEGKGSIRNNDGNYRIALLPGSRKKEIEYLIKDMIGAAEIVSQRMENVSFILPLAPGIDRQIIEKNLAGKEISLEIVNGQAREILKSSDFAVICSGTATLEAAITETPFIIVYRLSKMTEILGKRLLKIKNWGLVNIIAGAEVVPELQQEEVNPENIASFILESLKSEERLNETKRNLFELKKMLGSADVSKRVSEILLQYV